jgi:hypothetical protein
MSKRKKQGEQSFGVNLEIEIKDTLHGEDTKSDIETSDF